MERTEKKHFQLQKNTLKFNLIVLISITLFSCSNELEQTVYKYNSEKYNQKIKEFKIPIEKASNIASELYFRNHPNDKEYSFNLDFILGDYYIFCTPSRLYNLKTTEYLLSGIWVNGKTGKVIKQDTKEYIKVVLDVPFSDQTCYSGIITKPN